MAGSAGFSVRNLNREPKDLRHIMFSIFSLNLRFGLAADGPNSWSARKTAYPELLNRYRADFYCFQEANDFQIEFLQTILAGCRVVGKRSPSPKFWQNNVIFYRSPWECTFHDHFFLSHTPWIPSRFKESRWPRQCTLGIFRKGNVSCICVTTHFDFDPEVQVMSVRLILDRLARLPHGLPTVICGDFNAEPGAPCWTVFTETGPKLEDYSGGFKNVFSEPYPGTHHGFTGKENGRHIDWILYRGKLRKTRSEVITEDLKGIYPSDHFPLWASFTC
jgi:endonuclease/exonuclease/phosphatase family metal-dependent hydrolase